MRRWITALLVGGLVAGGAVAGTAAEAPQLPLKTPGQLSVGSDIPYAPFEFYAKPGSSQVVGFDVDLVNSVAKTLGITKVNFVRTKFDTILLSIAQHKFDLVASSVSITPKRAKQVLFSAPYFKANQSVMVRKGSDIKSIKDLTGKTVGAQRGTTGADLASKIKDVDLKQYELIDDAFNALAAGRVDAVVNDFAISAYASKAKPQLQVVQQVPTNEGYGLVFAKDQTTLQKAFNRGLATIRKNGTYAKIYRKWFGTAPPS
jgi:ABC-type amino acid transport substrate-binding protein